MSDLVEKSGEVQERGGDAQPPVAYVPGRRRRLVNAVGFVVILAIGIVLAGVLIATKPKLAPVARQETVYTVRTQPVAFTDNRPELRVYGEIAAGHETDLRALVQGDIVGVSRNFRNGGAVSRGEALVVIDRFEYEAAIKETRARIAETKAQIKAESLSLKQDREMQALRDDDARRFERLFKKGSVSEKARDEAILQLTQQTQTVARREAALLSQQARLAQLEVELERAERDLERTVLRAPFDGFLSAVTAQKGSLVNSNDKIAHIVSSGAFEARGHLSDAQYGRLLQDGGLEGRPARVHWKVGARSIDYDAVIARLTASIAAETGGVTFYALLDADGNDLPIRPGAFVEITLPDQHFPDSIRVPAVAVHDDSRVFVLADGRLSERAVEILGREGDDVIIRGRLEAGERVVLTRFAEMAPGVRAQDPSLGDGPEDQKPATGG